MSSPKATPNVANAPGTSESQQVDYFESKGLPTGSTMAIKSLAGQSVGSSTTCMATLGNGAEGWFEEQPSAATTDPQALPPATSKLLKGGAWNDAQSQAKSAARLRYFPAFQGQSFGFRLALIPKP